MPYSPCTAMTCCSEANVITHGHQEYILIDEEEVTLIVMLFCANINSRGTATMFDCLRIVTCWVSFPFILMTKGPQICHMIQASSNVTLQPLITLVRKVVSKSGSDGHWRSSYSSCAFIAPLICQLVNIFMLSLTVWKNVEPDVLPSNLSMMCNPDSCSTKQRSIIP